MLLAACWSAAAPLPAQDVVESARREATEKLTAAEAAAAAAATTQRHPDYVAATRRDGEIVTTLERAERLLESARRALQSAGRRPSRTGFKDAGIVASGASREFGKFEDRARKMLRRIEAERRPPPPPPPPPPPATPPDELKQAADAFFGGDYESTVALLSETRFRSSKARAHSHLLRSAARYALFLLSGESDYALRGEAIEDVLACREAAPDLKPAEELFSPRFRQFFAATE